MRARRIRQTDPTGATEGYGRVPRLQSSIDTATATHQANRRDAQAKGLAEYLRAVEVDIPVELPGAAG